MIARFESGEVLLTTRIGEILQYIHGGVIARYVALGQLAGKGMGVQVGGPRSLAETQPALRIIAASQLDSHVAFPIAGSQGQACQRFLRHFQCNAHVRNLCHNDSDVNQFRFVCLIAAFDARDQALVRAGYRAAQADANTKVTSQALEARRNYMMSWPQYAREKDQRGEIQRQQTNGVTLANESVKVEWANKSAALRKSLDAQYAKYRDALRQDAK